MDIQGVRYIAYYYLKGKWNGGNEDHMAEQPERVAPMRKRGVGEAQIKWNRAVSKRKQRDRDDAPNDYGAAQLFTDTAGVVRRKVDGAKVRVQYADPLNPAKRRVKVMAQTHIDRYFAERKIPWRSWRAAENLLLIWRNCRYDSIKVSNLLGTGGGKGTLNEVSAKASDARKQYADIMRRLGTVGDRAIYAMVIADMSAREFAHKNGLGRDDGMGVLRVFLTALADYFGIPLAD